MRAQYKSLTSDKMAELDEYYRIMGKPNPYKGKGATAEQETKYRQQKQSQELRNQYNAAQHDAQIGMEGAGTSTYNAMGQNAAENWQQGLMGQMAQQYVRSAAQPAEEEEEEEYVRPNAIPYDWKALYQQDQGRGYNSPVKYGYAALPTTGSFLQQYGMR
jgi:hypothetical protein